MKKSKDDVNCEGPDVHDLGDDRDYPSHDSK